MTQGCSGANRCRWLSEEGLGDGSLSSWTYSRLAPSQWETALLCNDVSHWLGRNDSRFAPSQWETALHCNDVSHWLGASLGSTLLLCCRPSPDAETDVTRNTVLPLSCQGPPVVCGYVDLSRIYIPVEMGSTQIRTAKTLGSTRIRHRSITEVSDRHLIDIDLEDVCY